MTSLITSIVLAAVFGGRSEKVADNEGLLNKAFINPF
jgi:hypothetical protein